MAVETMTLPARKSNLVMRPFGSEGEFVVKNPARRTYHKMGAQEFFLLEQLDGNQSAAEVLAAFEAKFGEPITVDDLHDFVEMASERELLADGRTASATSTDD